MTQRVIVAHYNARGYIEGLWEIKVL